MRKVEVIYLGGFRSMVIVKSHMSNGSNFGVLQLNSMRSPGFLEVLPTLKNRWFHYHQNREIMGSKGPLLDKTLTWISSNKYMGAQKKLSAVD
jgi:hypothetical protein